MKYILIAVMAMTLSNCSTLIGEPSPEWVAYEPEDTTSQKEEGFCGERHCEPDSDKFPEAWNRWCNKSCPGYKD